MKDSPLVSILINNYNYAQFLGNAIESAFHQTYKNVEIIVVDDGSTDNSLEILEKYSDRILAVPKPNGGQASAFNMGVAKSQGDILCFLDADDLFTPEKVEEVVNVFQAHPEVNWCLHPLQYLHGDRIEMIRHTYTGSSGVYDVTDSMKRGKLKGKIPFEGTATSGVCLTRSLSQKLFPMPEEIRITSDDYIKYAALGTSPGYVLLKELSVQRIHANNAYTLRTGNRAKALKAKIHLLTAYWLKTNIPPIRKFANNLFATGINDYQHFDPENQEIVNNYLSTLTFSEKIEINLRSFYYRIKP